METNVVLRLAYLRALAPLDEEWLFYERALAHRLAGAVSALDAFTRFGESFDHSAAPIETLHCWREARAVLDELEAAQARQVAPISHDEDFTDGTVDPADVFDDRLADASPPNEWCADRGRVK